MSRTQGLDPEAVAAEVLDALDAGRQIAPFSQRLPGFGTEQAYSVAAALRRRRTARGEMQVGRKIGFTNRNIWPEYGVYAPIWGDMYDRTVREAAPGETISVSHLPEPRIEPEIVLGIGADLASGMTAADIASCIDWVAHGFEIVQSAFPDWRFAAADCIADSGLHGALLMGPRRRLRPDERADWHARLKDFRIELFRDGDRIDAGVGSNALDGPVEALAHLVDVLGRDADSPPVRAGEMVTTGTLTRAFPVAAGQKWATRLDGIDLPGLEIRIG